MTESTAGRPAGDAVPSPEGAALAQEQQEELMAAVNQLGPEDRLVIAYRFWFDLSEAEMAEALGCARSAVWPLVQRARGLRPGSGWERRRIGQTGVWKRAGDGESSHASDTGSKTPGVRKKT